jgi:hypothetical protein
LNGYSGKPSESLRTGAFLSQTIIQKWRDKWERISEVGSEGKLV